MIRHFTSNRADFQKLVDLLRSDVVCGIRSSQADSTRPYTEVRDITQLEQRLRVKAPLWFYLFRDRDYGLWFAGPYSIETASKIKALTPDERKQAYCKYGTIVLKAGDSRYPSMPWFYGDLRKDFCHFPEPPKVEDGYLLGPVDVNGHVTKKWRILNRSDPYPSDWKRGESVFIQLSPQWFMRLRHFWLWGVYRSPWDAVNGAHRIGRCIWTNSVSRAWCQRQTQCDRIDPEKTPSDAVPPRGGVTTSYQLRGQV
jgi:hypothetical protein